MRNERILDILRAKFRTPDGKPYTISDGFVRMDRVLGTDTNIEFTPIASQNTVTTSAVPLQLNDVFCCTDIFLYLYKANSADPNDVATAKPFTYPEPTVFSGVTTVNEAEQLQTIYNGALSITIDNINWVQALQTRNFYRVPRAQQGQYLTGFVDFAGTADVEQQLLNGEWSGFDYGGYPITPSINMSGRSKFSLQVKFPQGATMAGQNTTTNILSLQFKGFIVQNVGDVAAALESLRNITF